MTLALNNKAISPSSLASSSSSWSWTRIIPVIGLLYFVSLFLFLSPLCAKCRNLLEDIRRTSKIKWTQWTSEHPQVDHQTHQKPSAAICFSYCRWLEVPSPPSSMMGSTATSSGFPWQLPSPSACSLELAPYLLNPLETILGGLRSKRRKDSNYI